MAVTFANNMYTIVSPALGNYTDNTQAITIPTTPGTILVTATFPAGSFYYVYLLAAGTGLSSLQILEIQITVGGVVKHKVVDVAKVQFITYYAYYPTSTTVTFSTNSTIPIVVDAIHMNATSKFSFTANRFQFNVLSTTSVSSPVSAGYYTFTIQTTLVGPHTFSFQSEPYICPFSSAFTDINQIFLPCSHAMTNLHQ